MDIGKPIKTHTIEPAVNPVPRELPRKQPQRTDAPPRRFDPITPTAPVEDPAKAPTKVPAKP